MAELFLKDYEAELYKQGAQSKQQIKQKINNNARAAEQLRKQTASIETMLFGKLNEKQTDAFLDDVGFLYNVLLTAIDRCGDSEKMRETMLKKIQTMYKSKLNLI